MEVPLLRFRVSGLGFKVLFLIVQGFGVYGAGFGHWEFGRMWSVTSESGCFSSCSPQTAKLHMGCES